MVKVLSDIIQNNNTKMLFWVGCAGSFDDRIKKITKSFVNILKSINIDVYILGNEEKCSGDPAKRAGNEYLFQMQAMENIELFKKYNITKIITICPHCYNTFKNEYKELGYDFEVQHHFEFVQNLIDSNKLEVDTEKYKNSKITYHDPCYLGRANNIYDVPRNLLKKLEVNLLEMKAAKSRALCCGAGGAQMFKESEKGNLEINIKRTDQALSLNPDIIATGCPFCNIMLTDGVKDKGSNVKVYDILEILKIKNAD